MTDYKIRTISLAVPGEDYARDFAQYLRLAGGSGADLVAIPSGALDFDPAENPAADRQLRDAAGNAAIAFGFPRTVPMEDSLAAFSSIGIYDRGGFKSFYDKMRLSPFSDRIPAWLPIRWFAKSGADVLRSGLARRPVRVGAKTAMPFVCFESSFPGMRIPDGVDFILNLASDIAVGSGRAGQYAMARMNAIAEGVPLVRASEDGTSAIVSPYGRETARLDSSGVMDGLLPARLARTLFSYTGNAPILIVAAGILIWARRKGGKPRRRKNG